MAGQATVAIGDAQWLVDVALTPWELSQGLGGIAVIPAGRGMFFDLGYPQIIEVTTVPMLFPLDIAFLADGLTITEVHHDVAPGLLLACASPARYFLEVNAGEMAGVEAGATAVVTPMPLQELPQPPSWASAMYALAGMLVVAALLSAVVGGAATAALPETVEPKLLAHTGPGRKQARPARNHATVHSWTERDRLGIWITDSRTDKTIAEWWDAAARRMFEDGFFKPGTVRNQELSGSAFENSVLDYAENMGMLAPALSAATLPLPAGEVTPAALADKWSKAKRNSALALKDIEAISQRHDITECKEALLEYRDLDRSDYDDAEEYQEARDEAWNEFLERLESLSEEEEEDAKEGKYPCSVCGREMTPADAMMGRVCGACTREQHRRAVKGLPPLPQRDAATRPLKDGANRSDSADSGERPKLEYLADTPELLAWTIEDIGYRDRIDSAFAAALARARKGR